MSLFLSALAIAAWLACSVVIYGASFAYFQREYALLAEDDYAKDKSFSIFLGVLGLISGPIGLALNYILFDKFKHGLKWK